MSGYSPTGAAYGPVALQSEAAAPTRPPTRTQPARTGVSVLRAGLNTTHLRAGLNTTRSLQARALRRRGRGQPWRRRSPCTRRPWRMGRVGRPRPHPSHLIHAMMFMCPGLGWAAAAAPAVTPVAGAPPTPIARAPHPAPFGAHPRQGLLRTGEVGRRWRVGRGLRARRIRPPSGSACARIAVLPL